MPSLETVFGLVRDPVAKTATAYLPDRERAGVDRRRARKARGEGKHTKMPRMRVWGERGKEMGEIRRDGRTKLVMYQDLWKEPRDNNDMKRKEQMAELKKESGRGRS